MTWADAKLAGEARASVMLARVNEFEKQTGQHVTEVRLTDFEDEVSYNFIKGFHREKEWNYGFFKMANRAVKRALRKAGLRVVTVTIHLDDYFNWLAKSELSDSATSRAAFISQISEP